MHGGIYKSSYNVSSISYLICISFMARDVKYIFMCFFSYLAKWVSWHTLAIILFIMQLNFSVFPVDWDLHDACWFHYTVASLQRNKTLLTCWIISAMKYDSLSLQIEDENPHLGTTFFSKTLSSLMLFQFRLSWPQPTRKRCQLTQTVI
jgi:hypothetical protein